MYLPPDFNDKKLVHARALMREQPFASLISNGDEGHPFVSHLPLHLVTFLGPHAYLSPKVFPDLVRVPAWNCLEVHCTVEAHVAMLAAHESGNAEERAFADWMGRVGMAGLNAA